MSAWQFFGLIAALFLIAARCFTLTQADQDVFGYGAVFLFALAFVLGVLGVIY